MKTTILKQSLILLSSATLLAACGGDGGDSPVDDGGANPGESGAQALLYAYPDNGQSEVSTAAPVVLRFSSAVNLGEAQNSITVYEGDAQSGTMVAVTPESVAGEPNNVLLQPDEDLKPNQIYTVVIEDLRLRRGTAKDQTLTFTTRPLHEGPKSLVVKEDTFEVSRRMPDGSDMEPVMDFSSFRFQFTQPIDRATAMYGDGNTVVLRDGAGDPVDATLLIDGAYMTVDPDQEYLNAGETYTLDITAGLASTYGETLGDQSYTLTPKDSSPKGEPAILVQKLTQGTTSRLTGKPVNEVPVNGTLLGENKNITQASAEVVRAELADVTTYTDVTPIRLPKGTVLNGAEISPILIGGEVPAGFGSGDVTMTVLSDASGYLVPNPYAGNNPNALRIVHLLMDVGIATSEPRANGAFTQDLLHIELVGLAEVDPTAGVLNLDAVSVVEPNILGQEYGYAMLSFQLQSYKDQNNPPQVTQDTIQPELQSWVPGDNAENFKVGDSIVLNFSESLARETVNSNSITLREQGGDIIPANIKVDGSALVIDPEKKLENTRQSRNDMNVINSHVYEISIGPGITDLAGNPYEPQQVPLQFELPTIVEMAHYTGVENGAFVNVKREIPNQSPIVLSTYPGYPCVLEETSIDLQNNIIGVCKSGMKSNYSSPDPFLNASSPVDPSDYERITRRPDDVMRLPYLPKNRPIIVQLSKPIDSASVENGKTFLVEKIDLSTSTSTSVDGQIAVQSNMIIFWPNQTWQDGQLYRYTISSTNDMTNSTTAICDGTQSVCDIDGLPIQTQLRKTEVVSIDNGLGIIETPVETNAGGPDMVQYFRGGAATDSVLQILSAPSSDNNANFFSEVNLENMLGQFPQTFNLDAKNFTAEEIGLGEAAPSDPNSCTGNGPCLDPEGIKPVPNSSKLLSKQTSGLKYLTINNGLQVPQIEGLNTGCGYESDMTTPSTCPKNKFVYLNSSIIAEVGNYNPQLDAIDVKIWPGQVMVTSIPTFAITVSGQFVLGVESGPQRMRMRYAKNDPNCIDEPSNPCLRSQPIQGWLGVEDGELNLRAQVDAYVDALALEDYLDLRPVISFQWHHELISVPVSLKLSGNVDFLPDGRMSVSQFNSNSIEIKGHIFNEDFSNTNLYAIGGLIDLEIPIGGAHIKYISKPIK